MVTVAGMALAGCQSAETSEFQRVASSLEPVKKQAAKAGVITTRQELQAIIDETASPEDWKVLDDSIKKFSESKKRSGFNNDIVKLIDQDLPKDQAFISAMFKEISPALDEVVAGSKGGRVSIHRDWTKGHMSTIIFPEYALIMDVVKALCYRANWHAKQGRGSEALADLKSALSIGRISGSEPTLIGYLVETSCVALVSRSWETCLVSMKANQAFLDESRLVFSERPERKGSWHVGAELLFRLEYCENPKLINQPIVDAAGEGEVGPNINLPNVDYALMGKAFTVRALESTIELNKAFDSESYKESSEKLAAFDVRLNETKDPTMIIEQFASPVYSQANMTRFKTKNLAACRLAMIDVLTFKNKNGRYPKTLEEVGVKSLDLFTEKPLKYKQTPTGVVVYSVGSDLTDNGGNTLRVDSKSDDAIAYPFMPPKTQK